MSAPGRGFVELQDVLLDDDFPNIDVALRRGRHVDRDDVAWYALLTDGVDGEGPRFADAFVLADEWRAETNLAPMPAYDPAQRIDHVFVAGAPWQGADWVVDQWGYGPTEHYTSDHFAIAVTVAVP